MTGSPLGPSDQSFCCYSCYFHYHHPGRAALGQEFASRARLGKRSRASLPLCLSGHYSSQPADQRKGSLGRASCLFWGSSYPESNPWAWETSARKSAFYQVLISPPSLSGKLLHLIPCDIFSCGPCRDGVGWAYSVSAGTGSYWPFLSYS